MGNIKKRVGRKSCHMIKLGLNRVEKYLKKMRYSSFFVFISLISIHTHSQSVGIGSVQFVPLQMLEVRGDITINNASADAAFRINNIKVLQNKGAQNLFVGDDAGKNNIGVNNTFVGYYSGYTNTSGSGNTFFGAYTQYWGTTGSDNTFLGNAAGKVNNGGDRNVAIGSGALGNGGIQPKYDAIYIGAYAGHLSGGAGGDRNMMLGSYSGYNVSGTLGDNVFVGYKTGYNGINTEKCTFIGNYAGQNNNNGAGNLFVGYQAGSANVAGSYNVFMGYNAGLVSTAGYNTFVGYQAGNVNSTGANNTYLGYNANGTAALTNATAIGYNASVTASNSLILGNGVNVGIGTTAPGGMFQVNSTAPVTISAAGLISATNAGVNTIGGLTILGGGFYTSGSANIGEGSSSDINLYPIQRTDAAGIVNSTYTGTTFAPTSGTAVFNMFAVTPIINQTGGANGITRGICVNPTLTAAADFRAIETVSGNVIFGSTSGNVGIGCTTPKYKLHVVGDVTAEGGTINASSAIINTIITACSDIRFKKNITPLTNALQNVLSLKGVNYEWKVNEFPARHFTNEKQIGFIAQDIEKIFPQFVATDKEGYKSVDYSRLTPVLVEAIKDQQKMIEELQFQNQKLKSENTLRDEKFNELVKVLIYKGAITLVK